jgi:hypothetical protein
VMRRSRSAYGPVAGGGVAAGAEGIGEAAGTDTSVPPVAFSGITPSIGQAGITLAAALRR